VLPEDDADAEADENAAETPEELLAAAPAAALAEPAIALPALNARPSNRQGNTKLFAVFIDSPLWN
jgi:hypothetical protein